MASGCLALDAVQSFVRGMVDAGAADRIEEHLDACDECRALVAALARGEGGQAVAGTITGLESSAAAALALALTGFDVAAPDRHSGERSLLGSTLADTYRLVRMVGMGGMGVIYEAHHVRLRGKRYAVKLLAGQHAGSSEVLARFRREAEIASRLGHENIVETHDFNVTDGHAYMVMELLEGEDLAARIRTRGPLPIDDVKRIFDQAASALDAAHRAQIVHRDLKPSNVFLCRRGGRDDHVKVLDFGLSKVLDSMTVMTRQYSLLGTPAYMSPEQAEGRIQDIDPRADVFALAAIVWEMLTGTMAFAAPTIADALNKVRFVDPPDVHTLRPDLHPAVSAALRRALAKDRFARTPGMAELASELGAALFGAIPTISPPPARRMASQPGSLALAATASASGPSIHSAPAPTPAPWVAPPDVVPAPPWIVPGAHAHVPSPSGPFLPPLQAAPAGSRPGQTVPAPRGLIIAIIVGALVAVGIWLAVARSLTPGADAPEAGPAEAEPPQPQPSEARPAEPAAVPPAAAAAGDPASPEPAAPLVPWVALTFTVEPRVAAAIRVGGEPVVGGRVAIRRSDEPIVVTAEAKGYSSFRAQVVPDRDRTVPIALHKARPRTRTRPAVRGRPAAPTPAPKAKVAEPAATARPPAAPPAAATPTPQPATPQPAAPQPAPPPAPQPAARPAPQPARAQPTPQPKPQPARKPPPKRGAGTIFDQ